MPRTTRLLTWALLALCIAWPALITMLTTAAVWAIGYAATHLTITGTITALVLIAHAMPTPRTRTTTA